MSMEPLPQFMTLKEVAVKLKVSTDTLKRWVFRKSDPLPAVFFSDHTIRIPYEQLELWLDNMINKEVRKEDKE